MAWVPSHISCFILVNGSCITVFNQQQCPPNPASGSFPWDWRRGTPFLQGLTPVCLVPKLPLVSTWSQWLVLCHLYPGRVPISTLLAGMPLTVVTVSVQELIQNWKLTYLYQAAKKPGTEHVLVMNITSFPYPRSLGWQHIHHKLL